MLDVWRLAGALLVALLLLAGGAPPARASRLHLSNPKLRKLTGRAKIATSDVQGVRQAKQWLEVHSGFGERVLVMEHKAGAFKGIKSGEQVELQGVWLSRGAGGVRPVSGYTTAHSTNTFVSTTIKKTGARAAASAAPTVQTMLVQPDKPLGEPHDPAVAAAAAAGTYAAAAPVPVKLVLNKPFAVDIRTIIIPIAGVNPDGTSCTGTQPPKLDADTVRRLVFAELGGTNITVGSTFNKCSYGRARLTMANSRVADTVQLPCTGESWGIPWSFSKCDFDDFNGWSDAADEFLRTSGVPLDNYPYRVYLLPPSTCPFVGLGYIGCDGSYECRSWINGDFWGAPQAIVHEMGHNLFMAHAGSYQASGAYDEYADSTCTMGYCCSDRCPNTPHLWQLGWLSVKQLDDASLLAGQTVTLNISAQAASSQAGLRINASWARGTGDPIYLGFRTRVNQDVAMDAAMANKLLVYTSPVVTPLDAQFTTWRASLAAGQSWNGVPGAKSLAVVRFKRIVKGMAEVSVCRMSTGRLETKDSCNRGLDYDCNGVVGTADLRCRTLLGLPKRTLLSSNGGSGAAASAAAGDAAASGAAARGAAAGGAAGAAFG